MGHLLHIFIFPEGRTQTEQNSLIKIICSCEQVRSGNLKMKLLLLLLRCSLSCALNKAFCIF